MDFWPYIGLVVGCLLEGESALITGGFLTHRGIFNLYAVIPLFIVTTLILDWTYFFIGRGHGQKFLSKRPRLRWKIRKLTRRVEKAPVLLMLLYRFMYGVRIPMLITFGLSSFKTSKFLVYSLIGTCIWIAIYLFLGYHFGVLIEKEFQKIGKYQWHIAVGLFILFLVIFLILQKRSSNKLEQTSTSEAGDENSLVS